MALYGYIIDIALLFGFLFLETAESRQVPGLNEDDASSVFSSTHTTIAVCVSSVAFLMVLVVVLIKCGDCYNSEVSTEFHPASNGGAPKWGGAVGYSSDNTRGGAITFGESYDPDSAQAQGLPYSMIPANVPEHGTFVGYQTGSAGDGGTGGAPLMGYQSVVTASAPAPGGGSRHYNPAEDQEPPPSYSEARRHASLSER